MTEKDFVYYADLAADEMNDIDFYKYSDRELANFMQDESHPKANQEAIERFVDLVDQLESYKHVARKLNEKLIEALK